MICSCRSLQASALSFLLFFTSRRSRGRDMSCPNSLLSNPRKIATLRLSKVSGHTTELLEIQSDKPTCHVLFIPGNPGVVSFYKDFLESLYELLGASASVTAIGHISHTEKNWEHGKLFSLQDQIDHKVDFIKQELQNIELPIVLVGHSIGSYISLEMLRSLEKVTYLIGLYPFLMLNPLSKQQSNIENVAESSILSALLSFSVATLGLLPQCTLRFMLSKSLGSSWSDTAIDAACSHLLQYHTFRNMLYMALMEFRKLSEMPDWAFMRENHEKIAFLFGVDDHWGPLQMFEERCVENKSQWQLVSYENTDAYRLIKLIHAGLTSFVTKQRIKWRGRYIFYVGNGDSQVVSNTESFGRIEQGLQNNGSLFQSRLLVFLYQLKGKAILIVSVAPRLAQNGLPTM